MNAQVNCFLIGCSGSGITMFDGSDCLAQHQTRESVNPKSNSVKCKFGQDLIDVLSLDFLWIPRALKMAFDLIVPHSLPVNIATAWNLMKLVIMIKVDCFTFAFDDVEAFTDCSSSLVLGSAIII